VYQESSGFRISLLIHTACPLYPDVPDLLLIEIVNSLVLNIAVRIEQPESIYAIVKLFPFLFWGEDYVEGFIDPVSLQIVNEQSSASIARN
jgi:hypothetical protein